MEFKTLLYEKEGGIGIITFNRPQVMNALNGQTLTELSFLLDSIRTDEQVKCVIVTGGPKVFAAGGDIAYMAKINPLECEKFITQVHLAMHKIAGLEQPVIAAMAGLALGGGCEVALACDIRIAAEGTQIGLPEINLGLFPAGGGTQRLTRVVGIGWAKDMILTGDPVNTDTALKIGLITRVVPADKLMDEARKLAAKLAAKAPISLRVTKQCLNNSLTTDLAAGLLFEQKSFAFLAATEDQKEGLQAFLEKRSPVFKGC